ncbi:hypothetical protein BPY_23170 [Bifidobacterium psychraerophilum]
MLCKAHRKELAEALRGLVNGMYVLGEMRLRRVRIGGSQGHANPAFAPSPISESDQDLYEQVEDILQEAAATIGYWDHRDMAGLLRGLLLRLDRLCSHPECSTTFKRVTRAALKVEERTTPPEERIIYGRCLNPVCLREMSGMAGQREATCRYCGSTWAVSAIRAARRERYRSDPVDGRTRADRTLRMTPAEAAAWLRVQTGLPVKRFNVSNWIARDRLPSARASTEKGVWEFNPVELLDCIEKAG